MEARRFGFDDPSLLPSHKLYPTDEDIVAHYLLPRAAGVPNPYAHAVIDDDTLSCPPWELLRRHGLGDCDHAFFFGPPRDMEVRGGRMARVVRDAGTSDPIGVWRGEKGVDKEFFIVRGARDGAAEQVVKFRRYNLTYYEKGGTKKMSSGWVMHEYHLVHPNLVPGAVVARIGITGRAKKKAAIAGRADKKGKRKQQQLHAQAAAAVAPGPDQPGPSNYYDYDYGHAAGSAVVASDGGEGTSGGAGAQSMVDVHNGNDGCNGGVMGDDLSTSGYYMDLFNAGADAGINFLDPDPPGPSFYMGDLHGAGNAAALSGGARTSAHQGDFDYGGGAVGDATNSYYTNLLNFGEDNNCYDTNFLDDGNNCFNEDISHYQNQDADFTTQNKSNSEPHAGGNGS